MNPVNPIHISQFGANQVRIEAKNFDVDITVKTVKNTVFQKMALFIDHKLSDRKYIQLNIEGKPVLVKISELARKLNIAGANTAPTLEAMLVEAKCKTVFAKLEAHFQSKDPKELETVKGIVRLAYQSMARSAKSSNAAIEIPLKDRKILAWDTAEGLKIQTLSGERLGMGGQGEALKSYDFVRASEEGVLKLPREQKFEEELVHEAEVLAKLCSGSNVLGIQKPVKLVTNLLQVPKPRPAKKGPIIAGDSFKTHGHMGSKYDTDLSKVGPKIPLSDKLTIAYQLLHGLDHMHNQNITHGDIKPENVFFDQAKDPTGPRAYLADFGGAIHHTGAKRKHAMPVSTETFRSPGDTNASVLAYKSGNLELQQMIEQKADVFATCVSLCRTLANPPVNNPIHFPYKETGGGAPTEDLDPSVRVKLIEAGITARTADLLIKGMSPDYTARPSAETLLKAVREDLEKSDPARASAMNALTAPVLPSKGEVFVEWLET